MDIIRVESGILVQSNIEEQRQPLLEDQPTTTPEKPSKTPAQKAMRKTFKGTAHLANLLPTGSVLAFQILSPIFTNEGKCATVTNQSLSLALLVLCGVSCFALSFTDSFRDERGKVRYGLATFRGLWTINDGPSVTIPQEEASKYRLKFIDLFHAFMSILVFAAIALFDQNVVKCFDLAPSDEAKELLAALPVATGVICSMVFVAFPTKRRGIGFPLSRN